MRLRGSSEAAVGDLVTVALIAFVFPVVFIAAAVAALISAVRRLIPR
ncbi:MAG: hypothetical protein H0X18_12035 [Geodermatophilaceae bacterium]|nr:hypothetical protein [Geodermatophilaceae bacterium]